MVKWKEYRIEDLADIFNFKRKPLSSMERATRKGIYPYYGASGIIDYIDNYIFDGNYVLISEDGENLNTRNTPVAFTAKGKFWVNNHSHIIKGKKEFINNLIIYFFANLDLSPYLTGAVQPKLSKENLLSIPIFLPNSENSQKFISETLLSLDDKIDLLKRQNKTLETLAETLFRQWFIEEADESWEVTSLSEIVTHHKEMVNPSTFPQSIFHHYSLPAFDGGKVPQKEEGKEILSGKYRVIANSILVSKLNPRTPRIWALFGELESENAICSTEFQIVKPNNITWFSFIYCFLKSFQVTQKLMGASSGTSGSHQRVNPQDILDLTFQKPPEKLVIEYYEITKELFSKINSNFLQIRTLIQLRDTLLPKLMSGEVRVEV